MILSLSAKHNIGESDKYSWIKTTDITELKALFGSMYLRGLSGGNHNSVESLFSDTQGHYIFSAVISKNRFKCLLSHLTFDDYQDRQERRKLDRFAGIRDVCGKASMITWESIWHQVNMNHWTRRCIQCAIRLPFTSITLKNHITMEFYSSL